MNDVTNKEKEKILYKKKNNKKKKILRVSKKDNNKLLNVNFVSFQDTIKRNIVVFFNQLYRN